MKKSEQSLSRLNSILWSDDIPVEDIKNLLLLIIDVTGWKFSVIDFNLYDEHFLDQLRRDKILALESQEFERACVLRDQEKLLYAVY